MLIPSIANRSPQKIACIYCAFAARRRLLESSRLPSCSFSSQRRSYTVRQNAANSHGFNDSQKNDRQRSGQGNVQTGARSPDSRPKPPLINRGRKSAPPPWKSIKLSFEQKLNATLQQVYDSFKDHDLIKSIAADGGAEPAETLNQLWSRFTKPLLDYQHRPTHGTQISSRIAVDELLGDLHQAYRSADNRGFRRILDYHFLDSIVAPRFTDPILKRHESLADLRYPSEWFWEARALGRKVHLHVGPTNSGKTYQALQRLEQAESLGVYAGPLRLLAHEVYSRLNAIGRPCYLITGDERRLPTTPDVVHGSRFSTSCTVEMVPLSTTMDVCVIDEIQMIADKDRGWAWTQALLGVRARELHLCGEERVVPLIQQLCQANGEEVTVHRYERLSPLAPATKSLAGDLDKLRKGDCVVCFSIMSIQAMKKLIEEKTGRRVAVVYGSLPAETRAHQAELFNDPNNEYDILVASDAIGMGLNLAIKRIIFESVVKFDGRDHQLLEIPHLKQIAGRAGRFRVASGEENGNSSNRGGTVTTLESRDLEYVQQAMSQMPPPITKAGVVPNGDIVEKYAAYFPPETPFSYILQKLWSIARHMKHYFLCSLKEELWIADTIQPVTLSIRDRYTFCALPAGYGRAKDDKWRPLLQAYATAISEQKPAKLWEIKDLPLEVLEMEDPDDWRAHLSALEYLHQALICYMWLSFRFAGIFPHRMLAKHTAEMTETKIATMLASLNYSQKARSKLREAQYLRAQQFEEEKARQNDAIIETEQADDHEANDQPSDAESEGLGIEELEQLENNALLEDDYQTGLAEFPHEQVSPTTQMIPTEQEDNYALEGSFDGRQSEQPSEESQAIEQTAMIQGRLSTEAVIPDSSQEPALEPRQTP